MTIDQILTIAGAFGVPTIISSVAFWFIKKKLDGLSEERVKKKEEKEEEEKRQKEEIQLLKESQQALLRNELLEQYERYTESGYCSIARKDNYENLWKNYHRLGVNGVMDGCHKAVMSLPDAPTIDE